MASFEILQDQLCFTPILIPYSKSYIFLKTFREMCLVVSLRYNYLTRLFTLIIYLLGHCPLFHFLVRATLTLMLLSSNPA